MATLSESRFVRFLTFGALYFAQGMPWGFIALGYVVYMTDQGFDNKAIGDAMGLAYVPWSFKIVWGPLIDRFPSARFGRRRHFIIGAELIMGLTMLMLLLIIDNVDLRLMSAVLFLHNTFAAMQDVATDALAVDILPQRERGSANSVMWACKSAGTAVGGGAGMMLQKSFGWRVLFVVIAMIIFAIMALVLVVRERPRVDALRSAGEKRITVRELLRSFSFAPPLWGVAIAMLTPAGYALVSTVLTRTLRADMKFSAEAFSTLAVVEPISGAVGALLGGLLADRLGVRKVIGGFMIGIAAVHAVFALTPGLWPSFSFVVGWTIAQNVFIYGYSAASLGFFMTLSNPAVGATQFSVYMASVNLTYAWTKPLGGWLADTWGVPVSFLIAAAVQVVTIGLLPFCDHRVAEARFRVPADREVPLPEAARAPGS